MSWFRRAGHSLHSSPIHSPLHSHVHVVPSVDVFAVCAASQPRAATEHSTHSRSPFVSTR